MTVVLRPATSDDAEALTDIAQMAYAVYLPRMPPGLRPGPMDTDYEAAIARDEVWVAERRDRIAGFIVLVTADDHLLLENVAVRPDFQGAGVGRRLLTLAEDRAREKGFEQIRLYTHVVMIENQQLYERIGYRETHRTSELGFERVFYTKRL